jgi:hypothetical protein
MYQESIYNLIPKEYVPPPKSKKYISRHNPVKPPTGSTFINYTTSRPKVDPTQNLNLYLFRSPIWEEIDVIFRAHILIKETITRWEN